MVDDLKLLHVIHRKHFLVILKHALQYYKKLLKTLLKQHDAFCLTPLSNEKEGRGRGDDSHKALLTLFDDEHSMVCSPLTND